MDVSMSYLRTRMITVRSLLKRIEFAKLLLKTLYIKFYPRYTCCNEGKTLIRYFLCIITSFYGRGDVYELIYLA